MILVFGNTRERLRLEQESISQHLKNGAGQRPDISVMSIGVS
jgi:hypothetical protein